jgi:DNA-binding MarR family transcriptional regulator
MFSRLRRQLKDVATGAGLTPSQTAVLTRLWKEGASSASALADAERVRPQSMATILAGLDQHGLIRRAPDPDDGRRQMISLTAADACAQKATVRSARNGWPAPCRNAIRSGNEASSTTRCPCFSV